MYARDNLLSIVNIVNVLTKHGVYELPVFVSSSSFLIVTHNSKQEKHPFFKRSPYISTGHSNKKLRFSKRSISNKFIKSGNISKALLYKQKNVSSAHTKINIPSNCNTEIGNKVTTQHYTTQHSSQNSWLKAHKSRHVIQSLPNCNETKIGEKLKTQRSQG
jgi:hypothetical protein